MGTKSGLVVSERRRVRERAIREREIQKEWRCQRFLVSIPMVYYLQLQDICCMLAKSVMLNLKLEL